MYWRRPFNDYFDDYGNCALPVTLGARHSSDAVKVVVKGNEDVCNGAGRRTDVCILEEVLECKDMIL